MAFVQKGSPAATFGSATVTPTLTGVTAGNLLIMPVQWLNPANSSPPVAPSGWSVAIDPTGFATVGFPGYFTGTAIYYQANTAGGSISATVNTGGSGGWALQAIIAEFSGYATTSPLDQFTSSGTGSSVTSGNTGTTGTTVQATELVIVSLCAAGLSSNTANGISSPATSGYTAIDVEEDATAHAPGQSSYKEIVSAGTQTGAWTWTQTGEYAAVIATFMTPGGTNSASVAWLT